MTSPLSLSHLCPHDHPDHPYASWPSIPPNPIGRLALLTPEITARAASEIKTGKRFALDHTIFPSGALLYNRAPATHTVKRVDKGAATAEQATAEKGYQPIFDDFITINTQGSTQWDYFLHYSYPGSGHFYGGIKAEDIAAEKTGDYGVAAIAKAGGVQTRAILVDIPYYLEQNNLTPFDPLAVPSTHVVDYDFLQSVIAYCHLEPREGDVLLVRTGFEDAILEDSSRVSIGKGSHLEGVWAGVKPTRETIEWVWKTGFVAVGSDNPTFEDSGPPPTVTPFHPILLSGMGIMIGELFRLNEVAAECRRQGRWSFFLSSNPLMVEQGVASPPNAVAIF